MEGPTRHARNWGPGRFEGSHGPSRLDGRAMSVRLVLADDHPMIAMAVELLLRGSNFELAGSAPDGDEALAMIAELDPDMVLLDVDMPGLTGLEVLAELREQGARCKVVMVTAGLSQNQLLSTLRVAPDGLIAKVSQPEDLLKCLDAVWSGGRWVDPLFRQQLDHARNFGSGMDSLTARERELVELVGKGLRNRVIAERLNITEGTVKAYLHAIFEKTGVTSRTELALRAADLAGGVPTTDKHAGH